MQLPGLGVDEVRGKLAGIPAKKGVGQRAVAPVETGEVQAHEQLCQRVEQPGVQVGQPASGEQRAIRALRRQGGG